MNSVNPYALKENSIYFAIALVIFVILYAIKPINPFQPHGIALPTVKQALLPSHQPVVIYQQAPLNYQVLARVNVEGHSTMPIKAQELKVVQYGKKLAKSVGANGLLITGFGYQGAGPGTPAPLAKYVLYAQAIKIKS